MKFSMIFEAQIVTTRRARASSSDVMHECVEQAVLAEQMGFDRSLGGRAPLPQVVRPHERSRDIPFAFVAGKTERIRIGHGVVCLPFRMNHPVKVAERVAMLDMLSSKGRVDFGIGKGGTPQEAGAFQTEIADIPPQLEESARMIPKMWSEDVFEYHSETVRPAAAADPAQAPCRTRTRRCIIACTREETLEPGGRVGPRRASCWASAGPRRSRSKNRVYRDGHQAAHRRSPRFRTSPPSTFLPCVPPSCSTTGQTVRGPSATGVSGSSPMAINHWYNPGGEAKQPPVRRPRRRSSDVDFLVQPR